MDHVAVARAGRALVLIRSDIQSDVKELTGAPFNGRTVAQVDALAGILQELLAERTEAATAEEKLAIVLAIVNANHREVRCDCATCIYLDFGDDAMHETACNRCDVPYPCAEVEQVRSVLDEPLEVLGR